MELSDRDFVATAQEEKQNYACFYNHAVKNEKASLEAGHDVFIDKVYIMIVSPGQNKTEVRRPMQELDKKKYPQAWQAFQEKAEAPVVGTPINYLPGLSLARIEEMKGLNIRTIEQMAALSHSGLTALGMGAIELQQKAQAFLAKNTEEVVSLRQQVANLNAKVESLINSQAAAQQVRDDTLREEMLQSKAADIEKQLQNLPKRRGRPPKVQPG